MQSLTNLSHNINTLISNEKINTSTIEIKKSSLSKNKCGGCNVKLSVVQQGIKCKCSNSFCGNCRYPEKHNCSYNYKLEGKERLRDELVEVKGDKLEMRI